MGVFLMRITNELLLEKINNIKDDTEEIKEDFKSDSKEQWKYINKNAKKKELNQIND